MRSHWTAERVEAHVAGFLATTLDREAWSPHASHLVATVVVCRRHPREEALVVMREGIRRLAPRIGAPPDAYHETVTRLYVEVVHRLVAALDRGQPDHELVGEALARLGTAREERLRLWRAFYDDPEAVIGSADARARWIPPDRPLDPLPDWLLAPTR